MKKPLRTLFYGLKHEHSAGKLASLIKMRDEFEIVAVADDRARATPSYRADSLPIDGLKIVSGERPNPTEMYDHDLKVHEITLEACGYEKR